MKITTYFTVVEQTQIMYPFFLQPTKNSCRFKPTALRNILIKYMLEHLDLGSKDSWLSKVIELFTSQRIAVTCQENDV